MAIRISRVSRAALLLPLSVVAFAGCGPLDSNSPPAQVGQSPYPGPSAAPNGYPAPNGAPNGYPAAPGAPAGYPAAPGAPPPGYAQQPAPPTPGAANPGAAGPLGPIMTTDPAQLQAMFAQASQAAQAFLQPPGSAPAPGAAPAPAAAPPSAIPGFPGGVPGDLAGAGIAGLALLHAKGMQPEGSQAKGHLNEGGHLEFMVPMQAGKCYTIIGFSPPGQIRNLDLNLLAPPFYNILAGQDTSDDNVPVIGKSGAPMCPIVPVPLNYKVDIVARAGSGDVAVQLYSRPK